MELMKNLSKLIYYSYCYLHIWNVMSRHSFYLHYSLLQVGSGRGGAKDFGFCPKHKMRFKTLIWYEEMCTSHLNFHDLKSKLKLRANKRNFLTFKFLYNSIPSPPPQINRKYWKNLYFVPKRPLKYWNWDHMECKIG